MSNSKDVTRDVVNKIWDGDYTIMAAGNAAPSKEAVMAYGAKHGIQFPEDYIAHSTGSLGGILVEVKEEVWPHAKQFEVALSWTFCRAVYSFAFSSEAPDWLQIEVARAHFEERGHQVIPVLKVWSDPQVYCYNQSGNLVQYIHDEDIFEDVEMSWFEALEYELFELAKRKKDKIGES